ncbi:50S ribosome-binding GTPase [Laribacter hongkongensis]|uniref:GTPase n=1 Tax=Laribacter hongkongensis TaxID=168471 RepID=UPI001EFD06F5|nr:GTPase [Laribacter hongkongensis]MCG9059799.1 50S ribosome-binding GTPase [Laribacter hongkongensis]MCG9084141.1 50S ribosome-binding GTPase [Laribacter hongkongensis]MCG9086539.1 50S ribosome-binding GTPase [Laribacter hongkongensis]
MQTHLPDPAQLLECVHALEEVLPRWLPDTPPSTLAALRAKAASTTPHIMVYGFYNAGKSTLINALLGTELAQVDDCPCTDRVTAYDWRGYRLLDTPGVDAPLAHERVTAAELERCDIVLFVVNSSGSCDEAATWDTVIKLLGRDRQLMVIVNDRDGLLGDDQALQCQRERLYIHLQRAAAQAGIDDILSRVPIRFVHAKSALRGRKQQVPILLEHSGLLALEQAMDAFLAGCARHAPFFACQADLLDLVGKAERALQREVGHPVPERGADVRAVRLHLQESLNGGLAQGLGRLKNKLRWGMQQAGEAGHVEQMARAATDALQQDMTALCTRELEWAHATLEALQAFTSPELAHDADAAMLHGAFARSESGAVLTRLDLRDLTERLPLKKLVEDGVRAALKLGKQKLPDLFDGVGRQTIERYAQTAGRLVGPLLSLFLFVREIRQSRHADEEARRQAERQVQAVEETIGAFAEALRIQYRQWIDTVLDALLGPLEHQLAVQRAQFACRQEQAWADQALFEEIRARLR